MRRFLVLVVLLATLGLALTDAIWPKHPPLLIDGVTAEDARPAVWPTNASAPVEPRAIGGEAKQMIKPPSAPDSRAKFPGEDPAAVDGLAYVNKVVNASISFADDEAHYGVTEQMVSWPADLKGDCEDYALSKLVVLVNSGIGVVEYTRIRFAYGRAPDGKLYGHVLLEVRMPGGAIAFLDNNFDPLMTRRELEALGYKFFDW